MRAHICRVYGVTTCYLQTVNRKKDENDKLRYNEFLILLKIIGTPHVFKKTHADKFTMLRILFT